MEPQTDPEYTPLAPPAPPVKNKVEASDLERVIADETYVLLPDGRTTICQLTLLNGYTVMGKSACVDLANYNEQTGHHYARIDAVRQLWPLLGFALASKLAGVEMI